MSSINEKMGLRPAGQRAMMKLPNNRAQRAKLTSARCPVCACTGATLSRLRGREGWFVCTWCGHAWNPEEASA